MGHAHIYSVIVEMSAHVKDTAYYLSYYVNGFHEIGYKMS
jgi:hypothetical protein